MTPSMRYAIFAVAVLCPASGICDDAAVTRDEIKSAWVGKELSGTIPSGAGITMRLAADGTAELSGAATDAGKWRLSDDGYCTTWNRIRAGQERCFKVRRNGSTYTVLNPDGSLSGTFTSVK